MIMYSLFVCCVDKGYGSIVNYQEGFIFFV